MAEYWTWEVFNFSDTDILKALYVFWLEFLMKLYQMGTRCQLETDVTFNTPLQPRCGPITEEYRYPWKELISIYLDTKFFSGFY